jgi:hypothetical protein
MVYACPTREYVADAHLLKLKTLQNRILRAVGNFDRHTPVRKMHMALKIPYVYDYITKSRRKQKSSKFVQIQMYVQLDREKPCIECIRGLNLAVDRPTNVQATNCRFGLVK